MEGFGTASALEASTQQNFQVAPGQCLGNGRFISLLELGVNLPGKMSGLAFCINIGDENIK